MLFISKVSELHSPFSLTSLLITKTRSNQCSSQGVVSKLALVKSLPDSLAASLLASIVDGPFLDADKAVLVNAINIKIGVPADDTGNAKVQSCEHVHNYITQSDLQAMSSDKPLDSKMVFLSQRLSNIGLRHPSEKTFAMMVAILCPGEGGPTGDAECLSILRRFKTIFRSVVAKMPPLADAPRTYPLHPEEFRRVEAGDFKRVICESDFLFL